MCLTIKIPMVGAGKINHNCDASGGILAMCGPAPGIVITDQAGHQQGRTSLYSSITVPREGPYIGGSPS